MPIKNHNFKYNIPLLESGYEGLEDSSVGKVLALCTQGSELDTNNSCKTPGMVVLSWNAGEVGQGDL